MIIDFHSHILPGIDDGSAHVAQSIKMLHMEAEQGITHVDIRLSDELPRQDAGSGKFKHIINMQKYAG